MKIYFSSIILLIAGLTQAQKLDIGLFINPGVSKLIFQGNDFGFKSKWGFSGNAGMYLNKKLGKKSIIGFELLYAVFESQDIHEDELYTFDPTTLEKITLGHSKDLTKTHLTYVSLPVYYKFNLKKLYFKGGLQAMYLSKAGFETEINVEYNGVTTNHSESHGDIKGINKFDYGAKLSIQYILSERAVLGFEYYHGLRELGDKDAPVHRLNRQATLGLQYSLTKSNKKS